MPKVTKKRPYQSTVSPEHVHATGCTGRNLKVIEEDSIESLLAEMAGESTATVDVAAAASSLTGFVAEATGGVSDQLPNTELFDSTIVTRPISNEQRKRVAVVHSCLCSCSFCALLRHSI